MRSMSHRRITWINIFQRIRSEETNKVFFRYSRNASPLNSIFALSLSLQQINCKTIDLLPGTEDAEEHVEGDLDAVDEDETVLVGDELEVDGVDEGPDLPASLARGEEVVLDLGGDGSDAVAVDEAKVGEEDGHEDGAPEDLVDGDLGEDGLGVGSLDLGIKPVVEVVARGSVVDKTED